jgi:hypothetical protein
MLRIQSPLPEDLELIVERTIGACIEVHRELGPGLLESIFVSVRFVWSWRPAESLLSMRSESLSTTVDGFYVISGWTLSLKSRSFLRSSVLSGCTQCIMLSFSAI